MTDELTLGARLGRLARTIRGLHPLQIVTRPMRPIGRAAVALLRPGSAAVLRERFLPAPMELHTLAESERDRAAERLTRIPDGSLLRAYERTYGYELGAATGAPSPEWSTREASDPFPAAVRARRIAVAIRLGNRTLGLELARAARAVALQVELHLLANHLLEDAFGLVCAGAVACGHEADVWFAMGSLLLEWQLCEQFLGDGGHFERSASYHLAVTAALLETIELTRASGRRVPEAWRTTARRAVRWCRSVRAPDGTYPLFNDASLDAAPSVDAVVALAAALLESSSMPASDAPSVVVLPETGWTFLQSRDGAFVAVDTGPDGASYQPGHVHADALTFELWIGGRRVVVDHGVSSYGWDAARRESRSTRAHNTLEMEGIDSSEVWGAFRVGRRATARVVATGVEHDEAYVVAEHDGYRWLPGAPVHRRSVRLRPGRLEIIDELDGRAHGERASRLRIASEAEHLARIDPSPRCCSVADGAWYPRFADRHAARVFTQRATADDPRPIRWVLCW